VISPGGRYENVAVGAFQPETEKNPPGINQ